MSDSLLNVFSGVLSQQKYSDDEIIKAGREFAETGKKWPGVAEIVDIVMTNRQRIFTREQQQRQENQQISYENQMVTRPSIADKALHRYIFLSTGSRTPVSVGGYEEYALRVFKLDPDTLLNSHGNPVQATLFGEPLPQGEKWPQAGPLLPDKLYIDPWTNGAATGIGKSFPAPARGMSPKEILKQRRQAESEASPA